VIPALRFLNTSCVRDIPTSFRSFIEYLDDEAGTKEAGEAPLLEQDADGVKLMTVHKAKGQEWTLQQFGRSFSRASSTKRASCGVVAG
jgi:superfamily I DNA/RNA helicase